jgi:hypothetical protein
MRKNVQALEARATRQPPKPLPTPPAPPPALGWNGNPYDSSNVYIADFNQKRRNKTIRQRAAQRDNKHPLPGDTYPK